MHSYQLSCDFITGKHTPNHFDFGLDPISLFDQQKVRRVHPTAHTTVCQQEPSRHCESL